MTSIMTCYCRCITASHGICCWTLCILSFTYVPTFYFF